MYQVKCDLMDQVRSILSQKDATFLSFLVKINKLLL